MFVGRCACRGSWAFPPGPHVWVCVCVPFEVGDTLLTDSHIFWPHPPDVLPLGRFSPQGGLSIVRFPKITVPMQVCAVSKGSAWTCRWHAF